VLAEERGGDVVSAPKELRVVFWREDLSGADRGFAM
jgi:hypothetical protein